MSNRTDEAKLVHFAGVLGLSQRERRISQAGEVDYYWGTDDGTIIIPGRTLPDFAHDEAQMGRVMGCVKSIAANRDSMVTYIQWPTETLATMTGSVSKGWRVTSPDLQSAAFDLVLAVTGYEDE